MFHLRSISNYFNFKNYCYASRNVMTHVDRMHFLGNNRRNVLLSITYPDYRRS
jgi:hypothetical protein